MIPLTPRPDYIYLTEEMRYMVQELVNNHRMSKRWLSRELGFSCSTTVNAILGGRQKWISIAISERLFTVYRGMERRH